MKKTFSLLGAILVTILSAAVFLFSAGTVFPFLPVFGSVANILTVGYLHLWLPLCGLTVLLTAALCALRRGKVLYPVNLVLCVLSLAMTLYFTFSNASALKEYGVKTNVFLRKQDISAVSVDCLTYTESEYGPVSMNVYYLDDGAAGKPVMVYIHGGGWIFGSRNDHSYYSGMFAKRGYVVFSLDYDLSSETRHLSGSTETQLLEGFAWVAEHAGAYGADISRLYVTGGSAGANLALELSYKINGGIYTVSSDGTELPKVAAVSVTFPVCSLETFYRNPDLVLGSLARKMAFSYTGCAPGDAPMLYTSLAPANHITSDAPPTSILVGASDSLVPPEATYALVNALQNAGIPYRLVVIPYANHIFDTADGSMSSNAYLQLSFEWFECFR